MLPLYVSGLLVDQVVRLLKANGLKPVPISLSEMTRLHTNACVTVLSVTDSSEAICEVDALRERNYAGKLVVLVSSHLRENDLCNLYRAGTDHCITSGDSIDLLLAVVWSFVRRYGERDEDSVTIGDVTLDPVAHRVTVNDQTAHLTHSEFTLLKLMMKYPNKPLTREQLRQVIPRAQFNNPRDVDGYIARLRKVLGRGGVRQTWIRTISGVGYELTDTSR